MTVFSRSLSLRCLAAALIMLTIVGSAFAQDLPDPERATGPEIQAYRDQVIPTEYSPPARAWIYADVVVLAGLLLTGSWLVRKERPKRWVSIHLSAALLYFGIIRGGCICPVGATANVFLGLAHPELVGLATLALFLIPLIVALISGRVFCGTVCPLGAIQHLFSRKKTITVPRWLHRILLGLPILILLTTAGSVWLGHGFLPCHLDPYKLLFFQSHAIVQKITAWISLGHAEPTLILAGSGFTWGLFGIALVAGWFIPRIFCRYICPYSVLLGLLAATAFWRRRIDIAECTHCARCVKHCPVQAIEPSRDGKTLQLSSYQCVQCGNCFEICNRRTGAPRPTPSRASK